MNTIPASIPVLNWAAQRAGREEVVICQRFKNWNQWLSGQSQPTLKQLEEFARWTHTPIGYFFLPEPPKLGLPIADFRTVAKEGRKEPSPELLDTLYLCQQRQEWFRNYSLIHGLGRLKFCGSHTLQTPPEKAAREISETLKISIEERKKLPNWSEALGQLTSLAENAGVLVMASSIVGSNSSRKLLVEEFRGFALADDLAPLVFINAKDSKAAQMFTLAHELAHIWLGESGVSEPIAGLVPDQKTENWCNQVAAELLLPIQELRHTYSEQGPISEEIQRLAKIFKISTLVALRRLFDAGFINKATLWKCYQSEVERIGKVDKGSGGGGDFYRTLGARTGKRFLRAILSSTLEGQTLFLEAFRMLGVRKSETFYAAAQKFGVLV